MLKSALIRFRYPPHVYHEPPRQWMDRETYLKPQARNTDVVHFVRVPFHASMLVLWAAIFSPLQSRFKKAIPDLYVCVTLKLSLSLRMLFHSHRMRAFREE